MSLYQCEKCGCIENTSSGCYHCRNTDLFSGYQEGTSKGMALCSECGPLKFSDGTLTKFGVWHGDFKKRIYPLGTLYTDKEGNVREKDSDEYPDKT